MIDAFERIVLDDAPEHQRLGATTLSELAKRNREECLASVREQFELWLAEAGNADLTAADRIQMRELIDAKVNEVVDASIEKIRLRLLGQAPTH